MAGRAGRWVRRAAGTSLAVATGAIVYGTVAAPSRLDLPDAVSGERREMNRRAGPLSYYVAGTGDPVLLIHSINAAGSVYEVGPIFEELKRERRVYAVDLPGFGFSDRSSRDYDVDLYIDAILDMVDEIKAEAGGRPPDVLALSLSSEFLAHAASERPQAFRTLALVTPTGFDRASSAREASGEQTREVPGLHGFLSVPIWSRGLYNLLVTRPSIRFFLEKTFGSKRIDEGLFDYSYRTTHQPGARFAPYAFVSGCLFTAGIRRVYERLTLPVAVLHGTKGDFQDFSGIGWTRAKPNWQVRPFDTGALPHFETLGPFLDAYRDFLAHPPG